MRPEHADIGKKNNRSFFFPGAEHVDIKKKKIGVLIIFFLSVWTKNFELNFPEART